MKARGWHVSLPCHSNDSFFRPNHPGEYPRTYRISTKLTMTSKCRTLYKPHVTYNKYRPLVLHQSATTGNYYTGGARVHGTLQSTPGSSHFSVCLFAVCCVFVRSPDSNGAGLCPRVYRQRPWRIRRSALLRPRDFSRGRSRPATSLLMKSWKGLTAPLIRGVIRP